MKFDKLKPGMVLFDVHSEKMGNTTISSLGVWRVHVITVDHEKGFAMCSWNGNPPRPYYERGISKLKEKVPILVRTAMGCVRRPTREERKAIVASGIDKTTFRREEVLALMAHPSTTDSASGSPLRKDQRPDERKPASPELRLSAPQDGGQG